MYHKVKSINIQKTAFTFALLLHSITLIHYPTSLHTNRNCPLQLRSYNLTVNGSLKAVHWPQKHFKHSSVCVYTSRSMNCRLIGAPGHNKPCVLALTSVVIGDAQIWNFWMICPKNESTKKKLLTIFILALSFSIRRLKI